MKKTFFPALFSVSLLILFTGSLSAHCEIPCGIYDDEARVEMILEHATTIEKSMREIKTLENADPGNANQLIRWVMNKEDHANQLQEIVSQYFMTQRVKPGDENYEKKITVLHQLLISAMQCKQTTDEAHVAKVRELAGEFRELYFVDHGHTH